MHCPPARPLSGCLVSLHGLAARQVPNRLVQGSVLELKNRLHNTTGEIHSHTNSTNGRPFRHPHAGETRLTDICGKHHGQVLELGVVASLHGPKKVFVIFAYMKQSSKALGERVTGDMEWQMVLQDRETVLTVSTPSREAKAV